MCSWWSGIPALSRRPPLPSLPFYSRGYNKGSNKGALSLAERPSARTYRELLHTSVRTSRSFVFLKKKSSNLSPYRFAVYSLHCNSRDSVGVVSSPNLNPGVEISRASVARPTCTTYKGVCVGWTIFDRTFVCNDPLSPHTKEPSHWLNGAIYTCLFTRVHFIFSHWFGK